MIKMYNFKKMRELSDAGKSYSKIAGEVGSDRKTVAKYLKSNTVPKYKKREARTRQDPFSPFKERAQDFLKDTEKLLAVDIYELLKEDGYAGSERTIRRRIAEIKNTQDKERFFEQEYTPGEQSQFDFKEKVTIQFFDGDKILHLHFSTLPFSDHFFIQAYPNKNFECFMDGIHGFFEDIGGMTDAVRIDNLSPCVAKVHEGSRRTYTDSFQRAIDYYGFEVLPCRPAKGNDKGDVERDIRTHARRILRQIEVRKLKFKTLYDFNSWLREYRDKRLTDTNKEKKAKEVPKLKPLPPREESILNRVEEITASAHGTIYVGDYLYSVPDSAIGQKCKVVRTPNEVKIYHGTKLIVTHIRDNGNSIKLEHVLPSLVRKPGAMLRWAHKDILFPSSVFSKFYQMLKRTVSDNAEKDYLKTINLVQHVTLAEIEVGMSLALESSHPDPYELVKELLLGERRPENVIHLADYKKQVPLDVDLKCFDYLMNNNQGEIQ